MQHTATSRRTRLRLLLATFLGFALTSSKIHAAGPSAPVSISRETASEPVENDRRWYGWQIAAVDVPMIVAFDVGLHGGSTVLPAASMIGYTAGSPVIHLANRNRGPAIVGAVIRLSVPFASWAFVRVLVARSSPSTSDETRDLWGATVGGLAATAIDAGALAWRSPEGGDIVVHTGWSVSPWLPGRGRSVGLTAGYVGF